jgi:isopentenyldiphosphate isomerase
MSDEILEIVNEHGEIIGTAPRMTIHRDNSLLHRVVHLLLFNSKGLLLLQKRSPLKDVAPGTWDTSVGGHVAPGEDITTALKREMEEELSLTNCETDFLYRYIHRNEKESELVHSFRAIYDGNVNFNKDEIAEVRFWEPDEITRSIGSGIFSNNFIDEFQRYLEFSKMRPA